jgi:hypothetical protein
MTTDLAAQRSDVVGHLHWVGEILLVPDHILVIFRILDVKPKDINRHILLVEAFLYTAYVVRTDVIPTALVVPQCPVGR